jgi:hypothetical protein
MICTQPATLRKPVPDDAGLGMVIWPRYTGLVRSDQVAGLGILRLAASTELKHTALAKPHRPVQVGTAFLSR